MENLPHSVSKKAYNGNGYRAKTVYDDVFGGPPKFGVTTLSPCVSDYSEIFGSFHASRASSIPILDLPAVDDAEFSFDARSSMFDYSEVFGGLNGVDFAVSFEELFDHSKTTCDSSDEAWTPAQSESLSDESDLSASSERNKHLSNGESHQSCDDIKQINISYDKASQSKEDMSSGMAHVTQLHAVPGFTSGVNEAPSLQKIEDKNTLFQVIDDLNPKMDFSGGLREGKQFRKTMSHPSNRSFGIQTLGTDLKPVGYGKTASHMNETFVTVSDISLRTQPSQLPPPSKPPHGLAANGGDSDRHKSKLKASKSFAFGETTGDSSPPFFDVEVDASSSAAASAAAMKDVMEKAQAKLKSAKELMERKKEGLQSRTKLGLKNDTKDKEGKASKTFDVSNSFQDERVHGTCQRDYSGMKTFSGEERKKVMKTTQLVLDSIDGENHINVAKISADKKNGKEYRSSQEFYKTEGTVAWREAAQFYELVEMDKSRKIFEQAKDERVLVQSTESNECGQERKVIPVFRQQEEDNRKMKADRESCESDGNKGKSKATKESSRQEEHGKKVKVNQEVFKQEETGKKPRMVQHHGDIEKILTEAGKSEECEYLIGVQQKVNKMEVEKKLKEANKRIEDDKRHKDAHEREENERRLKETLEMEKYEKRLKEAFERAEIEKRLKEALEREEKEQQQREAIEREENEKRVTKAREREEQKRLKEALELEENEKILALMQEGNEERLKMALEWQRNEKRQELALEREKNERRLREDLRREEIDKKLKGALEQEENGKKQKEAYEREEIEERNEACEREGNKNRLKEAREQEENKKRLQEAHEREESEKRPEEAFMKKGIQKKIEEAFKQKEIEKRSEDANECEETQKRIEDPGYWEELQGWSKDHEQTERDENERKLKSDQGTCVHAEGANLKASDGARKLDDHENLQPGQAACKQDKNSGNVETEGNLSFEDDATMRTEPIDSEDTWMEAVDVVNMLFEEKFNSAGMAQDYPQHEKNQIKMKDVMKSSYLHDTVTESVEAGTGIGQTHIDRNKKALEIASNLGTPNGLTHELGEIGTNVKEVQVTFCKEESKDKFMSSQVVGELLENGKKMGADQTTVLEGKRNAQSTAQKVSTSKSTERKEKNLNDILTPEEREKEERIKRERELEKDRLRKVEEEREREREREKDRMAVDRATLEARERTFAEARERADRAAVERATAEVRQRAMTEARERLEKASAEARERSLAERASMEARLRAERAAVERATTEARERAFLKAMAEKASFEERQCVERSVSDKSFASYKNDGMRQSSSSSDLQDLQLQGIRSSSGSIYSYSSANGGIEGESAQRCKARLERHQRTAERAAKALAEKNMRDLLAQKEQTERNRFAEALDAEVKRWSSGKEGNLRALLSTLQYILGPDSGWRPIPLTEVITAAAVKKAYRKATLYVHPDKLQQRGASIQQKYICEKVFDLLKEAWNRFNSEER